MSSDIFTHLKWLPRLTEEDSLKLKKLSKLESDEGYLFLKKIMPFFYSYNECNKISKFLKKYPFFDQKVNFQKLKIAYLSNTTSSLLTPVLQASALRYGFVLDIWEADFDTIHSTVFNSSSRIYKENFDFIIFDVDYHALAFSDNLDSQESESLVVKEYIESFRNLLERVESSCDSTIILQTIPCPIENFFGSIESTTFNTRKRVVRQINQSLEVLSQDSNKLLLDVEAIANKIGLLNWFDPGLFNLSKVPYSQSVLLALGESLARLISSARGKSKKVLVLDLDNTLWGGVIGDDGLEGIRLGQGDSVGEAHVEIQKMAKMLRSRGVLLAVSSKNEDSIARQAFEDHPEMILKKSDIAVFQANWNDKATNIKTIAEALNLGLDSFVFLDDNPVERALVRENLPMVSVPELPEDASLYPTYLYCAGYFDLISFSQEDRQRATFYEGNAKRLSIKKQFCDMDSYLKSLKMIAQITPFDGLGRSRITQLVNKSNQFNLRTKRYSEAQIKEFEESEKHLTFQFRLKDKFGDNGMISVLIGEIKDRVIFVDTWLMSCRVLERRVEELVIQYLVEKAISLGIEKIQAEYIPTEKNVIVKDLYSKLGFKKISDEKGVTSWELVVSEWQFKELPISIQNS